MARLRMRRSILRTTMAVIVAAAAGAAGIGCVDGATPDCSDAAARCNPDFDAYPPDTADDTSPTDGAVDTGPVETGPDAPADTAADTSADAGRG